MKSIFNLIIIITIIIITTAELYSQNITKWDYIDSTDLSYGFISGHDKNDFVTFGANTKIFSYGNYYSCFEMSLYNNVGKNHKVIYYDTLHGHFSVFDSLSGLYGDDNFANLAHPSGNVIIATGYNKTYIGYFDNTDQYKYSSLMIISTDGGNTFQRKILDSNETLGTVIMFDSLNGMVIKCENDNYFNKKDTLHDSLRITNDCWKTYKSLPSPIDVSHLKAFSPNILTCYRWEGRNTIFYRSIDGGGNWQKYTVINYTISNIKFLTKDKVIGIGEDIDNNYRILKSDNGGADWREIDSIKLRINGNIHFINSIRYSYIDFCDSLNGFLTEQGGSIFKTTDGGESWAQEFFPFSEKYPNLSQTQEKFSSIIYPSKDFAIALAQYDFVLITENKLILCPPHFYRPVNRYYEPVNKVRLSWTNIDGAKKYRLRVSGAINESGLANFNNPQLDTLISDTSFVMNNLKYNSYYDCWIKAIADTSESDWSFEYLLFRTLTHEGTLYPPSLTYPAQNDTGVPVNTTLNWDSVIGATKYEMTLYKLLDPITLEIELIKEDSNIVANFYRLDSTMLESNTTYWVYLRSKNSDTSSGYSNNIFTTGTIAGINDFNTYFNNLGLTIFPNPASEKCIIRLSNGLHSLTSLKIYNSIGREVADLTSALKLQYGNNNIELNLSSLNNGVYLIIALDGQNIYSKSFILLN